MYEDDDTSWSFAIGLFVGALAGAAAASLFTPRSGTQNRELVLEKGVVLKDRVADATSSATTSVKDATSSAVTKVSDTVGTVRDKASAAAGTVTDAASSAATKVSDTASSTVEKLQSAASVAAEKVSDATSAASERASTIVEKVSDATSSATERVSTLAHTAAEKVSDATDKVASVASTATDKVASVASTATDKVASVASTATDKARELRGRTDETVDSTLTTPATSEQISSASYDTEDVRPATATPHATLGGTATTQPLQTLSALDTFESTMADTTASTTIEPEAAARAAGNPSTADVYGSQFVTQAPSKAQAAQAELGSAEQFEVSDTLGDEASEGAERSA